MKIFLVLFLSCFLQNAVLAQSQKPMNIMSKPIRNQLLNRTCQYLKQGYTPGEVRNMLIRLTYDNAYPNYRLVPVDTSVDELTNLTNIALIQLEAINIIDEAVSQRCRQFLPLYQ